MLTSTLHLLGLGLLLVGPAYAALLLSRRIWYDAPPTLRWSAAGVLWIAWLVLCFRVVGTLGVLTPTTMVLLALAPAALALVFQGGPGRLREECRHLREWWQWLGEEWLRPLVLVVLVVLVVLLTRALAQPPLEWDSISYHLTFAGHWIQQGALVPFAGPEDMEGYAHFPENGEILAACYMLPFHADTLLGLLNFPTLLLIWFALLALGEEFGLPRLYRFLLAASLCLSPMLLHYVTSAYVDMFVTAELLCAVLFFFRYLRTDRGADALLALVAVGLAAGTKLSSLPILALVGALVAAREFLRPRRGACIRWKLLAAGVLVILALGSQRYILNALETGNPFYPCGFSILGIVDLPESEHLGRTIEKLGLGSAEMDWQSLVTLLTYWGDSSVYRAAGPKFILFALLALLFIARAPAHVGRLRSAILVVLWASPIALFYLDESPNTVLLRRVWMHDSPRFLATSLALMALSAFMVLPDHRLVRRAAKLVLVGFMVIDLLYADLRLYHPREELAPLLAGLLLLMLVLALARYLVRRRVPAARIITAAVTLILAGAWTSRLQGYRDASRWTYYGHELHRETRKFAAGWEFCDRRSQPLTIALLHESERGDSWFWYPLMGGHLQNRLVHVPPPASGGAEAWLEDLLRLEVDLLFLQSPPPPEARWLREHPERFSEQTHSDHYAIYLLHRDR